MEFVHETGNKGPIQEKIILPWEWFKSNSVNTRVTLYKKLFNRTKETNTTLINLNFKSFNFFQFYLTFVITYKLQHSRFLNKFSIIIWRVWFILKPSYKSVCLCGKGLYQLTLSNHGKIKTNNMIIFKHFLPKLEPWKRLAVRYTIIICIGWFTIETSIRTYEEYFWSFLVETLWR